MAASPFVYLTRSLQITCRSGKISWLLIYFHFKNTIVLYVFQNQYQGIKLFLYLQRRKDTKEWFDVPRTSDLFWHKAEKLSTCWLRGNFVDSCNCKDQNKFWVQILLNWVIQAISSALIQFLFLGPHFLRDSLCSRAVFFSR